jgi:carbonic anhydrase
MDTMGSKAHGGEGHRNAPCRAGAGVAAAVLLACAAPGGTGSHGSHASHWSYAGAQGQQHWSEISAEFQMCGKGQNQSPLDIVEAVDADLPALSVAYRWELPEIANLGHALQVSSAPGSWLTAKGNRFELVQFHFHSPSENRIQGKSYPLEAHFVHRNAAGELAVLAVLFDSGPANPSLGKILAAAPRAQGKDSASLKLAEKDLLPENRAYYLYSGSLTTPPCTEGVRWFVLQSPRTVSADQAAEFVRLFGKNARDPQPLGSRIVLR